MKKTLLIILSLVLVFSLAACGGNNNNNSGSGNDTPLNRPDNTSTNTTNRNGPTAADFDMDAILSGSGSGALVGGMDEATKQQFIAEAKADGYDVTFSADGSMTMTDADTGEKIVQKPDGSWSVDAGDGEGSMDISTDGKWPDNELTKLLPKPDFDIGTTIDTTNSIVVTATATVEQAKAYAEACKGKGFTINEETEDMAMSGMVIFVYTAENNAGYMLSITFTSGSTTIMLEKP